jgi:hypothetical protein
VAELTAANATDADRTGGGTVPRLGAEETDAVELAALLAGRLGGDLLAAAPPSGALPLRLFPWRPVRVCRRVFHGVIGIIKLINGHPLTEDLGTDDGAGSQLRRRIVLRHRLLALHNIEVGARRGAVGFAIATAPAVFPAAGTGQLVAGEGGGVAGEGGGWGEGGVGVHGWPPSSARGRRRRTPEPAWLAARGGRGGELQV